jgi:anti-sigma factor RsiW
MEHETCHHLLNSLSGYVDHDLSPELCAEIERHMAGCENCRIVIDTLRMTIELYHETSADPCLPAEVRQRLFARLALDDFARST